MTSNQLPQSGAAARVPPVTDWPTIALVTPNLNGEAFLRETLKSVLDQHYPSLEYVFVDGGSTDDSLRVAMEYSNSLSALISEPDEGHADALNKGFSRTSGEIMGWINSDDILLPGSLETVAALFSTHPEIHWITGKIGTIRESGGRTTSKPPWRFRRQSVLRGAFAVLQQESTFWRRSLWERAGGRLETGLDLAIDFELWMRFSRHESVAMVEANLGSFRVRSGQRSQVFAASYRQEVRETIQRERILEGIPVSRQLGATSLHGLNRQVVLLLSLLSRTKDLMGLSVYDLSARDVRAAVERFSASVQEKPS